ncbi:MAG: barstar family protein [Thermoanaerobaculia bacterium]
MTLGSLTVHFASSDAAEALRANAAYHLAEIAGGPSLFGELASALELPDNFGHSWEALHEALQDLDIEQTLVLLVHNAATRWQRAPEEMQALVDVWISAATEHGNDLHLVFVW